MQYEIKHFSELAVNIVMFGLIREVLWLAKFVREDIGEIEVEDNIGTERSVQ